jgi:hypothetical protein
MCPAITMTFRVNERIKTSTIFKLYNMDQSTTLRFTRSMIMGTLCVNSQWHSAHSFRKAGVPVVRLCLRWGYWPCSRTIVSAPAFCPVYLVLSVTPCGVISYTLLTHRDAVPCKPKYQFRIIVGSFVSSFEEGHEDLEGTKVKRIVHPAVIFARLSQPDETAFSPFPDSKRRSCGSPPQIGVVRLPIHLCPRLAVQRKCASLS